MLKGHNIKYKSSGISSSGKVSCLLLLFLTFLLVNPTTTSASALEAEETSDSAANYDNQISTQSDNASSVQISFAPTAATNSVTPTTSAGVSVQANVLATVKVQNSGGYTVYLKSSSTDLTGKNNSTNTIPAATSAKTYDGMDVNTWGYYAAEGTTVPDNATYKPISISGNGDELATNTDKKITSDTKNIMLSFAAKINNEKPSDTYQNTVTMSVVSSPYQTSLSEITNMQDMTTSICDASDMYETKQLKDTRDGKYYWVTKLADNKCWMTQNLDLDLNASTTPLTSVTSDVSTDWTPGDAGKNPAYTETTASSSTVYSKTSGQRSWSLGNYRISDPTASSSCGYPKNSAADCSVQFTAYDTPTAANGDANAHYILGNHYQWDAATAGGEITANGQASSSICPKGWKLPESNSTAVGSFGGLINAGSIGSDIVKLASSPYYFVRGGFVNQSVSYLFYGAGAYGDYWPSTPNGNGYAYIFSFSGTNSNSAISGNSYGERYRGHSIRCVAH